ncbi:MAG: hypothetical protein RLZZ79_842 [Actinomycetota bacterium]
MAKSTELWRAPFRGRNPINSIVTIPGSKSVTNRALILAALSDSPSILRRPLISRDTELMIKGLRALGVGIELDGELLHIKPAPLFGPASIDVGNAGTVMRFMLPVAALATGLINFDGDPRSHERPLAPLIKALEDLGVLIDHHARYALPLTINGDGRISGGEVEVDASTSSQFLSALLLAGAKMTNGLSVRHSGANLPSQPHIDMTIAMLRRFGADVDSSQAGRWKVANGKLSGADIVIEPDLSNAAPFMAMTLLCGGELIIRDWPKATTQPGDRLRDIFTQMGGSMEFVPEGLKITGTGEVLGIEIDLHDEGELTPSIAAVAALAQTPSYLRGIGHLRLHETDRLAALNRELSGLGCEVIEEADALRIIPQPLHGATFHTYEDHRLATAGAIIGLQVPDVLVEDIATTRKTLPDFPGLWSEILDK